LRRADRHRLSLVSRGENFRAASRSAQIRPRRGHRRDQSDDRSSRARHHQPPHARDRTHVGRGTRIPTRRGRARTAARQGRGAGLGRLFAQVGRAGGFPSAVPCLPAS
jgi:hypothetical protein